MNKCYEVLHIEEESAHRQRYILRQKRMAYGSLQHHEHQMDREQNIIMQIKKSQNKKLWQPSLSYEQNEEDLLGIRSQMWFWRPWREWNGNKERIAGRRPHRVRIYGVEFWNACTQNGKMENKKRWCFVHHCKERIYRALAMQSEGSSGNIQYCLYTYMRARGWGSDQEELVQAAKEEEQRLATTPALGLCTTIMQLFISQGNPAWFGIEQHTQWRSSSMNGKKRQAGYIYIYI